MCFSSNIIYDKVKKDEMGRASSSHGGNREQKYEILIGNSVV